MWAKYLMQVLQILPMIVTGIEHIHHDAPGATKKQLALEALGLAYGTASTVLPEHQGAIDAATSLAANAIDGVVSTLNAAGVLQKVNAAAKAVQNMTQLPVPIAAVPAIAAPVTTADAVTIADDEYAAPIAPPATSSATAPEHQAKRGD